MITKEYPYWSASDMEEANQLTMPDIPGFDRLGSWQDGDRAAFFLEICNRFGRETDPSKLAGAD